MSGGLCFLGDVGVDRFVESFGEVDRVGGCALNAALAARSASPDLDISLVAPIGSDSEGTRLYAALKRVGLAHGITQIHGLTPRQSIKLEPSGERTFRGYEAGVLPDWRPGMAQKALVFDAAITLTIAFSQIEALFDDVVALPRRGKMFVDFMDLNDFGKTTAVVERHLTAIDGAFFGLNENDTELLSALRSLAERSGKMLIVTLGAAGCVVFAGAVVHLAPAVALPPGDIVDTTGAGDAFAGTFLACLLRGLDIPAAIDSATKVGAAAVQRRGGAALEM